MARTINDLPEKVGTRIKQLKLDYEKLNELHPEIGAIVTGYLTGLVDTDTITEDERRTFYYYITL